MQHKRKKRVVIKHITRVNEQPNTHFKRNYHTYLIIATGMLSISALLFGLEHLELVHQLETAGGMGALGAVLIMVITW